MQDLNDLYYFARVVEHGGFAPAESHGSPRRPNSGASAAGKRLEKQRRGRIAGIRDLLDANPTLGGARKRSAKTRRRHHGPGS